MRTASSCPVVQLASPHIQPGPGADKQGWASEQMGRQTEVVATSRKLSWCFARCATATWAALRCRCHAPAAGTGSGDPSGVSMWRMECRGSRDEAPRTCGEAKRSESVRRLACARMGQSAATLFTARSLPSLAKRTRLQSDIESLSPY
jgi:hypothetical protein